jgi:cytochrome P450
MHVQDSKPAEVNAVLEPFTPEYVRDPYPVFTRLRAGAAAQFVDDLGLWVVSRDEEIRGVLAAGESFANALSLVPVLPICPAAGQILGAMTNDPFAGADGSDHARRRRAVMAVFPASPRKAAAYEPLVSSIAAELIGQLAGRHEADLVRDFAWELAGRVMLDLIGVPREDQERIKLGSRGRAALLAGEPAEAEQIRLSRDLVSFWRYCRELVARRVDEPGDDLVSALLAHRAGDDAVLTEREIASIALDCLAAGHETSSNLISSAVFHLLRSGRWDELVADPARFPPAIEEVLRYDPPVVGWLRNTTRAVRVGDVEIGAGQRVLLLLGSANRDERRLADAGSFDIDRADPDDHLSFSHGRHFCIGAALARLEARVALEALAESLPRLRLRDGHEPRYVPSFEFRELEILPVAWDPATPAS